MCVFLLPVVSLFCLSVLTSVWFFFSYHIYLSLCFRVKWEEDDDKEEKKIKDENYE